MCSSVQRGVIVFHRVTANGSKGCAENLGCMKDTEDTISLLVAWEKKGDPTEMATGVYTASWTAPPKAGVRSNQYFHCKFLSLTISFIGINKTDSNL